MNLQPGDRLAVYEYTRINPTQAQINQWIAAQKAGNWWMPKPGEAHNKYRVWPDYLIHVKRVEGSSVYVISPQFTFSLNLTGVRVPATHCELLERAVVPEQRAVEAIEECEVVSLEAARRRKNSNFVQGALL